MGARLFDGRRIFTRSPVERANPVRLTSKAHEQVWHAHQQHKGRPCASHRPAANEFRWPPACPPSKPNREHARGNELVRLASRQVGDGCCARPPLCIALISPSGNIVLARPRGSLTGRAPDRQASERGSELGARDSPRPLALWPRPADLVQIVARQSAKTDRTSAANYGATAAAAANVSLLRYLYLAAR